jgi:protein tyrosine/serine phosphatase
METYREEVGMMRTRVGNKAPDWGHEYGLTELWTEVVSGLWVGGTADQDTVENGRGRVAPYRFFDLEDGEITTKQFDAVVTMYAWAQPVDWGVEELRWGIMDGDQPVDRAKLQETVDWAHRRWDAGNRVLIRCQAGLNRSSLVTALVLVKAGWTPDDAIKQIRFTRSPQALFNKAFVKLIKSHT